MKFSSLSCLYLSALHLPGIAVAQLSDGPLTQPMELSSTGTNLEIDLTIAAGSHSSVVASTFETRLLNGSLPGPTVRVKRGEWLYVNFSNDLVAQSGTNTRENQFAFPDSSNLHFHGPHVSGERPGDDTTIVVDPGESYRYELFFPAFHIGGTHWLHPHRHGSVTQQVGGGAASVLIVEDAPGEVPPEVANAEEVVLMVQLFDKGYFEDRLQPVDGDRLFNLDTVSSIGDNAFLLVNGQYQPTLDMIAGDWQRWRVVFGSWDRSPLDFELDSDGDCETILLAKDGIYIQDYPRSIGFFPVTTGGRADIMVRCSSTGTFQAKSYRGDLFSLNVVAPPGGSGAIDVSTPPTTGWAFNRPNYLSDLRNTPPTSGCACDTRMASLQLNGMSYDPDVYLHTIALGSTVERTISGISNHPYHQHVYPYQLTDLPNLDALDANYFKVGDYHDVIQFFQGDEVTVRYVANNYHGRMTVHCHRGTHSDVGMLSAELVVDPKDGGVCDCSSTNGGGGFSRPPTNPPTEAPIADPTEAPTKAPTEAPIADPTEAPTKAPTKAPTEAPIADPTEAPIADETCADQSGKYVLKKNGKKRTCRSVENKSGKKLTRECKKVIVFGDDPKAKVKDYCKRACGLNGQGDCKFLADEN